MKPNKIYFPLFLSAAVALGLLLGSKLSTFSDYQSNNKKAKLNRLIDLIDRDYVDDINTDSIVDLTVNKILENLDPHSVYIDPKEMVAVNESMRGDFVGIGVNFYMYHDTVAVIKPVKEGPSEKAGIKAGDRILAAGDYTLYGKNLPNDSLFGKLKGPEGSAVNLTIYRKTEKKEFKVKVLRDIIPLKSVDISFMTDNLTGYIKINRFSETTYREFHNALLKLKAQGMTRLMIDLRGNGGGYLEMAVAIADDLLPKGDVIVKVKNKKGKVDTTFATEKGEFETGELYILIDENSASASEILAGAIQDNDRGTIVGRRSFGKGLVQREMPLGDGSAVRLTVARYYTPSGRSIQKPYGDKGEGYFNEFEKRFANGELYEADSIKVADSLKYRTKEGRTVYGGGGIIPDVFVPFEANHGEEATIMVMQSGLVNYFAFEQIDKSRNYFDQLNLTELKEEIFSDEKYLDEFKKYISGSGILLSFHQKDKILTYLYAEFVRQLKTDLDYYKILLQQDNMAQKVLSLEK